MLIEEKKTAQKLGDKQTIKINEDLIDLSRLGGVFEDQISRLNTSINRIHPIEEEKAGQGEDSKNRQFEELSLQEKIERIKDQYNWIFNKFCYLNEMFERRI